MNTIKSSFIITILFAVALLLTGCKNMSNTTKGAVIGTGGGAAVGAVIGKILVIRPQVP
jgi:predicted small secreted protein